MSTVYGYTRVSTAKQGEGVSLTEQKRAIADYARKHNLTISKWFEEKETAAKRGRPVFSKMLTKLKDGKANGVVMHKIDRSARNLKDWADLADLNDQGVGVYFAHESLDMTARGGRLTADIQAVIASDYIRNLRQEAKKGLYGRLKQGVYPFRAPIGYVDTGGGNLKEIHPVKGPLVRMIFQRYATGQYSLETLLDWACKKGLTNHKNGKLSLNGISTILNNPFYMGLMQVKGQVYQGKHEALITASLFEKVQRILHGKTYPRSIKHDFLYRRRIQCGFCNRSLIGEKQKGRVYYRCHGKNCPTTSIREDRATLAFQRVISSLSFSEKSLHEVQRLLLDSHNDQKTQAEAATRSLELQAATLTQRLDKLTDALLDGLLEGDVYRDKKNSILMEQNKVNERIKEIDSSYDPLHSKANKTLELLKAVANTYDLAIPYEQVDFLESTTSNLTAKAKSLYVSMRSPFDKLVEMRNYEKCEDTRGSSRTLYTLFDRWVKFFPEKGLFVFDTTETPSAEYLREHDPKRRHNVTSPEKLYEVLKDNIYQPHEDES